MKTAPLTYSGRAKYSIVPKGRTGNCATLASGTSIAITGVTGATVLSKEGTGTVTIGTNVINRATDGTLYNLKLTLTNGRVLTLPLTEGSGTTVWGYDSTGQNYTGTITASDINAFWGGKQTTFFPSLQYGYAKGENRIPNSHAVGASVGVAPTGWSLGSNLGVSWAVAAVGDGYVDVRCSGTASSAASPQLRFVPTAISIPAVSGESWTASVNVSVLSGSLSGVNCILRERNSGGSTLASNMTAISGSASYSSSRVLNQATCAFVDFFIESNVGSGATIDFTIRISQPQLTKTATQQPYYRTVGTATTGLEVIPANPNTPGFDVNGNALTHQPLRLNPSSLYSMPDALQCRDALDHTAGTASVFYDANNVPTEVSVYTFKEAAVGPNLFLNPDKETKGIVLYSTDRTAAEELKLWKLLGSQYALPTPTAFFNGVDTTGMTSYASGAATFIDVDGKLRISPANTMARTGMRYEGGVYYDTTAGGSAIVTSTDQPTRTGDSNFQVFTPSTTFKRYSTANPLTMPGFLCEPARTNKCTCVKANPTATTNVTKSGDAASVLSVVNDSAALAAAGLDKICTSGNVYKLDNSLGGSAATATITGADNTNAHVRSAYIKGGTGRIGTSSTVGTTFAASSTYVRRGDARTSAGGLGTVITADANQTVYFILPQLEEGAFATSPICTLDTTAAETRAATVLTYPTAGKIRSNNMAFRMIVVPRAANQDARLFGCRTDSDNSIYINITSSTITFAKYVSGTLYGATRSYTNTTDIPIEIIAVQSSTLGMLLCYRTYSGSQWGAWSANGSDATGTQAAILASTYQLGARGDGANQFTGNISLFETLPIPAGVSDPLAWAKQQWNIT